MTFLEELRWETAKACRDKRYKELTAKRLCGPEPLDDLREAMLAAAKKGGVFNPCPDRGLGRPGMEACLLQGLQKP